MNSEVVGKLCKLMPVFHPDEKFPLGSTYLYEDSPLFKESFSNGEDTILEDLNIRISGQTVLMILEQFSATIKRIYINKKNSNPHYKKYQFFKTLAPDGQIYWMETRYANFEIEP
jgi:hypothetical protein